jgi:hypothetical protein
MKTLGIILVAIGLFMVLLPGINFTKKEEVLDTGSIQINKKENKNITWPWYAGGVITVLGIVMLVAGNKKIR